MGKELHKLLIVCKNTFWQEGKEAYGSTQCSTTTLERPRMQETGTVPSIESPTHHQWISHLWWYAAVLDRVALLVQCVNVVWHLPIPLCSITYCSGHLVPKSSSRGPLQPFQNFFLGWRSWRLNLEPNLSKERTLLFHRAIQTPKVPKLWCHPSLGSSVSTHLRGGWWGYDCHNWGGVHLPEPVLASREVLKIATATHFQFRNCKLEVGFHNTAWASLIQTAWEREGVWISGMAKFQNIYINMKRNAFSCSFPCYP